MLLPEIRKEVLKMKNTMLMAVVREKSSFEKEAYTVYSFKDTFELRHFADCFRGVLVVVCSYRDDCTEDEFLQQFFKDYNIK